MQCVERIESGKYDVIILNFANCDMVGHTGVFEAAVKAVETVDDLRGPAWWTPSCKMGGICPHHRRPRQRRADDRAGRRAPSPPTPPIRCPSASWAPT